jgi:voltage-gated potassium channel
MPLVCGCIIYRSKPTIRSAFRGLCGVFALLSVLVIFIESGLGTQYHLTLDEWHIFVWLELVVTAVFTFEYFLRIISWPNPLKYIFSLGHY